MKFMDIILLILGCIFLIIVLISIIQGTITYNQCMNLCKSKGTDTFQRIQNNEFNMNDYCICYFENDVYTSTLNEVT